MSSANEEEPTTVGEIVGEVLEAAEEVKATQIITEEAIEAVVEVVTHKRSLREAIFGCFIDSWKRIVAKLKSD